MVKQKLWGDILITTQLHYDSSEIIQPVELVIDSGYMSVKFDFLKDDITLVRTIVAYEEND